MATDEGDANFVSTLDEKSKAKAKSELGELNDKDRALAVQTLRRWVLDQKDWMPSRTGAIQLDRIKELGTHAVYRAMVLVYEWMMFDENTQVNGMLFMVDYTDMGWQLYMKYASIQDQSNLLKFLQRLYMGNKLTRLYEEVDRSAIPDEYLPDDCTGAGPKQKIIEEMIEDMMKPKFRDYIRDVSSSKYKVDIDKREHMDKEPANSFRKLNVD